MATKPSPGVQVIPVEFIERKIYLIRGFKVMLDADLAKLYHAPTKILNQAVRRNLDRFPEDFMFQPNMEELQNWRSQIVTSNPGAKMGLRRPPHAFTEHGVAMLSSVLKSKRAVALNILIRSTAHTSSRFTIILNGSSNRLPADPGAGSVLHRQQN